jgi:tripartite-type tricarboxylate transporter receptor subunit TctC
MESFRNFCTGVPGGLLCVVLVLATHAATLCAQEYPNRSVHIVAPFPPGGGADINARRLAERLNKLWGQQVIVDNIAGAAGGLAAANVAKSKPDGYTLFFVTHPILAINPAIYEKLPYDPDKDFAPVVQLTELPTVLLVGPSLQVTRVADLVSLAKAKPGTLNFGSGGVGTSLHLAGELFKSATGVDIAHVPYKGTAPAFVALLGNDIQMMFDSSASALQHLQGGRVRGVAVASMTRLRAAPAIPTFDESGLRDFVVTLAYGIMVPAGTPAALAAALNRDFNTVLNDAEYRKQMADDGANVIGGSPEHFRQFLAAERSKWGALVQKLGIKGG